MNSFRIASPAAPCRTGRSHTNHSTAFLRRRVLRPRRSTSSRSKSGRSRAPRRGQNSRRRRTTFGAGVFLVVGGSADDAWVRQYDGRNFADVDASIVATYIMLAIHNEGLRSTWVGHFDAPKLKEAFPQMADYDLIAIFPVGYATEKGVPSPRHTQRKAAAEIVEVL